MEKMKTVSVTGFKDTNVNTPAVSEKVSKTKAEKKQYFMQSAGKIRIDVEAVNRPREGSRI